MMTDAVLSKALNADAAENWRSKNLSGSIPSYIKELTALKELDLSKNGITGVIPQEMVSLEKLKILDLSENELEGNIQVINAMTSIKKLYLGENKNLGGFLELRNLKDLDGHFSPMTAPDFFPNIQTVDDVKSLSTFDYGEEVNEGNLHKRIVGAFFPTRYGTFTCSTNPITMSPFRDCLNLMAAYCRETSPLFSGWPSCQGKIKDVRDLLNANWINYINSCANFIPDGNATSDRCKSATNTILTKEYYYYHGSDGVLKYALIPKFVTDSVEYIWHTTSE